MQRSKATFDFANHKQTGYTMRFMENLCAGRKIITNNKRALSEPFYSPNRIHVFDDLNFDGIKEFLDKPLKQDGTEEIEQFYIQNFVKRYCHDSYEKMSADNAVELLFHGIADASCPQEVRL